MNEYSPRRLAAAIFERRPLNGFRTAAMIFIGVALVDNDTPDEDAGAYADGTEPDSNETLGL